MFALEDMFSSSVVRLAFSVIIGRLGHPSQRQHTNERFRRNRSLYQTRWTDSHARKILHSNVLLSYHGSVYDRDEGCWWANDAVWSNCTGYCCNWWVGHSPMSGHFWRNFRGTFQLFQYSWSIFIDRKKNFATLFFVECSKKSVPFFNSFAFFFPFHFQYTSKIFYYKNWKDSKCRYTYDKRYQELLGTSKTNYL